MNLNTLKIGDLIVRQKGPFSTHYLVWIGWHNGIQVVAENQSGIGVRYVSLQEALAGNPIKRFEPFGGTEYQRHLVVGKINSMLGKKYDLVVFNCEHFARWISTGKIESKQVKIASNIFLIAGGLMLTNKNTAIRLFGVTLLLIGSLGHLSQS